MKKILLPTDFSENAWNAISYALELHKDQKCQFFVLNTYMPTPVHTDYGNIYPIAVPPNNFEIDHSENGLRQVMDRIKKEYKNPDHTFDTISALSPLTDKVQEVVKEKNIDLVIMGTQGASGLQEFIMGSMTQNVVSYLYNCPVLVIPKDSKYSPITNIAFASSFEHPFHDYQLKPLLDLARDQDADIRIIQACEESSLDRKQLENYKQLNAIFSDSTDFKHQLIANKGSIEESIQVFVEENKPQLLSLIQYEHGFWENLTREAVVRKITFHTEIPLLVLPEKSR